MGVALADQPGVEVLAVEADVPQQPSVAVPRVTCAVLLKLDLLAFERRLGVGAGLRPKVFHRFSGVFGFRGIDSPVRRTVYSFPPLWFVFPG